MTALFHHWSLVWSTRMDPWLPAASDRYDGWTAGVVARGNVRAVSMLFHATALAVKREFVLPPSRPEAEVAQIIDVVAAAGAVEVRGAL
jgi:hypothetical protein